MAKKKTKAEQFNEAVDLIRSTLAVARRKGVNTNWEALERKCETFCESLNLKPTNHLTHATKK